MRRSFPRFSAVTVRRHGGSAGVLVTAGLSAWLAGSVVTLIALVVGGLLAGLGRRLRWSDNAALSWTKHAIEATVLLCAGLWVMATAAMLSAPAAHASGSVHFLDGLGDAAAALDQTRAGLPWSTIADVLIGGALASSVVAAHALRRPGDLRGQSLDAARDRVRALVREHGQDSLSPYVLRADKQFEIAADGLVAFSVIADTVVVSGDPVGSPEGADRALAQLVARARRSGLGITAYGASATYLDSFARLGLRALPTGEEAVVDPSGFTLEGRAVRKLRQSVNRIERRGWEISLHEGRVIGADLEAEIAAVERTWRADQPRVLGFAMSMGAHESAIGAEDLYALARSPEGELGAVMRFFAHCDRLSLDVMRRVGETPNGLNEALLCRALEHARIAQVSEVSLNYAGLSHLFRNPTDRPGLRRRLTLPVLVSLRRRFQMDRLITFNEKFSPQWRPRYLVYESAASLPRSVWRVLQAEGHLPQPRLAAPPVPTSAALSRPQAASGSLYR